MATGDITIRIDSETKAFKQGVDTGMIKPLEDAEKALDDLGKSRGPEQLEKQLEDAQKATDNLADETKDAARIIEREFKDSYSKMKQSSDKGIGGAKEGLEEFGRESNSTAKESAASFDGSAESIVQSFQEIAANAFAGFGPAGAIAGLAIAAGIGLGVKGFEDMTEANEKAKEEAAEWANAYVEAGGRILTAAQQVAAVQAITTDPERYKEAEDNAKEWGVSVGLAMLAMSGNAFALEESLDSLRKKEQQVADTPIVDQTSSQFLYLLEETRNGREALDKLNGAMDAGASQADAYSESLRLIAQNTEGAVTKVDKFGDSITKLPDGTTIYVDAETGQATQDIEAVENKQYSANMKVFADITAAEKKIRDLANRPLLLKANLKIEDYGRKIV